MPRFHCPVALISGSTLLLPAGTARHVQVLRLQPGDTIALFHGGLPADLPAGEEPLWAWGWFEATITRMGRSDVEVLVGEQHAVPSEAGPRVHLLAVMPANERMDWLVEKATELGAASIQPLMGERSVLRLKGERADKKQAHWQAVAVAACEQSGRTVVPQLHPVATLASWFDRHTASQGARWMLSLAGGALPLRERAAQPLQEVWVLSGPEGGLSEAEETRALREGFLPLSLGEYVLRSETAPLAVLAVLTLR